MNFLLIFLGVIVLYFLFRTFQAVGTLRYIKEKTEYFIRELETKYINKTYDTFYYIQRGSYFMQRQDFISATDDFAKALIMIDNGSKIIDIETGIEISNIKVIREGILANLSYCKKPLPWSKNGPKDLSNNAIVFVLIERLGNKRQIF